MKKILLKKEYIYQGNLILVNSKYDIKEKVKNYNLIPFDEKYSHILLDYNANLDLQKLLKEIEAKNKIIPVSGYRSLEEQEQIWEDSVKENGEEFTRKYVAYPNCSEHQTGLAIDLGIKQRKIDFIRPAFPHTGIAQEFRKKIANYGFIERYTQDKEKITKISSEEWHFRYVGYPHSKIMLNMNLCLEEYIEYLKRFQFGVECLTFENYEIAYIKMNESIKEIVMQDDVIVNISGNNVDGLIITQNLPTRE